MTEPPTVRSKGRDQASKSIETLSRTFELTSQLLHLEKMDAFLQGVAESVRSQFGFDRVSISILDEATGGFAEPTMAGYSDTERAEILSNPSAFSYDEIMQDFREDCRVSRIAYFIPYEKQTSSVDDFILVRDTQSAIQPRESPEEWHELDLLYFALKDQRGDIIGYMQADYPRDHKIPSLETIQEMELFASVAAVGIENSKMFRKTRSYLDLLTHDVGNLITPIDVYLDVVINTTTLTKDQIKFLSTARESARSIVTLIANLQQSTQTIGGVEAFRVPQDLAALLRETPEDSGVEGASWSGISATELHGIVKGILELEPLDIILHRIARTISVRLGVKFVIVGVRNDLSALFEERVIYGYSSEQLANVPRQSYTIERMKYDLREEFAIAPDTYYVRPFETGVVHQDDIKYYSDNPDMLYIPRKTESEWQPLDYIDFIIKDKEGNWIGWVELFEPIDGMAPSADSIQRIRLLTDLAGIAIESRKLRAISGQ